MQDVAYLDQEIRAVVRSLCQGTPNEQHRTIEQYFTKNASFIHPFCAVPHFDERRVPVLGSISSRDVMEGIFRWYRMLSPKIEIEIDSALYDQDRNRLYLDMRQVFVIWFLPFYSAPVRLVTVLDLVAGEDQKQSSDGGNKTWKISKQEDLYQVNEYLKFVSIGLPGFFWSLFQLAASAVCIFMSFFWPLSPWNLQKQPARGGKEVSIQQIDSEKKDRGKGVADSGDTQNNGGDKKENNGGDKKANDSGDKKANNVGDKKANDGGDKKANDGSGKKANNVGDKKANDGGDKKANDGGDKKANNVGDKKANDGGDKKAAAKPTGAENKARGNAAADSGHPQQSNGSGASSASRTSKDSPASSQKKGRQES